MGKIIGGGFANVIKSIQRGTITLNDNASSATATITAVVVANSFVTWGQAKTSINAAGGWLNYNPAQMMTAVTLTNTTTVTASKLGTVGAGAQSHTVTYEVIEFYPGILKSNTSFTLSIGSGNTSATTALPSVDVNKSFIVSTGWCTAGITTSNPDTVMPQVVITNSTTLTASRVTSAAFALECHGAVLEFY